MNLFDISKQYDFKYTNNIVQNVDLTKISFTDLSSVQFNFLKHNIKYSELLCEDILILKVDNDGCFNEEFPYFVLDVYVKKLNTDKLKSAFNYYKHNFRNNIESEYNLLYIIGNDIILII